MRDLARSAEINLADIQDKDDIVQLLLRTAEQFRQDTPPSTDDGRAGNPAEGAMTPEKAADPFAAAWGTEFRLSQRARLVLLPPGKLPEKLFEHLISADVRKKVLKVYPMDQRLPQSVPDLPVAWQQGLSSAQARLNSNLRQVQQRFYEAMRPVFKLYSFLETAEEMEGRDSLEDFPLAESEAIFVDFSTLFFSAMACLNAFRRETNLQQKGGSALAKAMRPRGATNEIRVSIFGTEQMEQMADLSRMEKAVKKFGSKRTNSPRPSPRRSYKRPRYAGGSPNIRRFSGKRGGRGGAKRSAPPQNKQN